MKTETNGFFASNQFLVTTRNSYRLMDIISADHEAKLLGQISIPQIALLYTFFSPLRTDYTNAYTDWQHTHASSQEKTKKVNDLLKELSSKKIATWDANIQTQFLPDTAEYIGLLPEGRNPFQNGGIDLRISKVGAFLKNLGGHPTLIHVKNDVQLFHSRLDQARKQQQSLEGLLKEKSELVEIQRVIIGEGMFANLGSLMKIYCKETWRIGKFFDLENIQRTSSDGNGDPPEPVVSLTLNPGATIESGLALTADMVVGITNTGTTSLKVSMSTNAGQPGGEGRILQPGESIELFAAELGWTEGSYLNITNESGTVNGSVEVYLIS